MGSICCMLYAVPNCTVCTYCAVQYSVPYLINCAVLCSLLYYVLCCAVLHWAVLCCAVLYCAVSTQVGTVLTWTVPYVQYFTVQHWTELCDRYCAVICCVVPYSMLPCCTGLYCAVLCCAVLFCAVLCCILLSCAARSYLLRLPPTPTANGRRTSVSFYLCHIHMYVYLT